MRNAGVLTKSVPAVCAATPSPRTVQARPAFGIGGRAPRAVAGATGAGVDPVIVPLPALGVSHC